MNGYQNWVNGSGDGGFLVPDGLALKIAADLEVAGFHRDESPHYHVEFGKSVTDFRISEPVERVEWQSEPPTEPGWYRTSTPSGLMSICEIFYSSDYDPPGILWDHRPIEFLPSPEEGE